MGLQLPQAAHTAYGKLLPVLFNAVQPQSGKVDDGSFLSIAHFQPHHAPNQHIAAFLVQGVGLLQALCPSVFLCPKHAFSSLVFFISASNDKHRTRTGIWPMPQGSNAPCTRNGYLPFSCCPAK